MLASDLDYDLPPDSIAQYPLPRRDASRMLLLDRVSGRWQDRQFSELPEILRGDELLVANNSRVLPARLFAHRAGVVKAESPGKGNRARHRFLQSLIEVLLIRHVDGELWEALVRPGKKVRVGERLTFEGQGVVEGGQKLEAEVVGRAELGLRTLRLCGSGGEPARIIEAIGHVPLPPYIRRADESSDRERYQTIFAKIPGAVAAPTAGLHFTAEVLRRLRERGVEFQEITLDIGLGTFQPVHTEHLEDHPIHREAYEIPEKTADAIVAAKREHRPVLAIGTTVVRALEDSAKKASTGIVEPGRATAEILITPGWRFAAVDQLLTNFHLPRSTLLALVAAFAGRDTVLSAYRHAIASGYRFYSYGDCMLVR